jgi:hypothetical protein
MSETKKRQQVILLHGSDAFTLEKAQEKGLVKGELVVEHGTNGVKLHTLDKDSKLATFINEAAINAEFVKTNQAVETNATNIGELQATVGDANGGLVKDVATHGADIQEIRESLGLEAKPGDSTLASRIADLELAVGDDTKGLVKDVADNANAIETHIGNYNAYVATNDAKNELFKGILTGYDKTNTVAAALAQEVTDRNQAIADAINEYNTNTVKAIGTNVETALEGVGTNATAIGELKSVLKGYEDEGSVATAVKAAKTEVKAAAVAEGAKNYVSVTEGTGTNGQTVYSIGVTGFADGKDFELVDGKVNTLVGEDTGKSVRTIANEELAAQLLSGKADADFETLQALAAWLEDHPEEVAEINAAIANLQKVLTGYTTENAVKNAFTEVGKTTDGLNTRLQAVEADYINGITANCEVAVAAKTDAEGNFTHKWDFDFSSLKIDGGTY